MRTNKLFLLTLTVLAVGCGSQKPTAFVDLEAALAAETDTSNAQALQTPTTKDWSLRKSVGEEDVPAEQLAARPNSEAIRNARETIKENQEDARRAAKDRLFKQYLRQVSKVRAEKSADIAKANSKDEQAAEDRISALLLEYAKKRHPLVDSVNPYTGFPLPAIEKLTISGEVSPAVKKLLTEIRTKLVEIDRLDHEFAEKKEAVYQEARNTAAKRKLDLELEIQKQIDALLVQAEQETNSMFEKDQTLYEGILISRPGETSKALPGKSALVDLNVSSPTLPKWGAEPTPSIEMRRAELERELSIFLAVRRYERTMDKAGGVDLTKDFIAWRSKHRLGR